jgi:hypothetical protein
MPTERHPRLLLGGNPPLAGDDHGDHRQNEESAGAQLDLRAAARRLGAQRSGAITHGCTAVDANTVRCPSAGITFFDLATPQGDDDVSLAGVPVPSRVLAGVGGDAVLTPSPSTQTDVLCRAASTGRRNAPR